MVYNIIQPTSDILNFEAIVIRLNQHHRRAHDSNIDVLYYTCMKLITDQAEFGFILLVDFILFLVYSGILAK